MYRFGALLGATFFLCACPTKDNPVWGLGGESESEGSGGTVAPSDVGNVGHVGHDDRGHGYSWLLVNGC